MREHIWYLPKVTSHFLQLDEKLNSSITLWTTIFHPLKKTQDKRLQIIN